jgi:hypothetical protein
MITDYLKAGYPVLMVRTHEPEEKSLNRAGLCQLNWQTEK